MSYREALLEGKIGAERLHEKLQTASTIEKQGGRIDVFGTVLNLGAALQFSPVDGILGAFLKPEGKPGVLITSRRSLAVQRFTGAHELGHFFMEHEPNVDGEDILAGNSGKPDVEVQANSFASEFLTPQWLLELHARRQGWGYDHVRDPRFVYQLSLRLGTSYEATCRRLQQRKIIERHETERLLVVAPKTIKQDLVKQYAPNFAPANWYPDVWWLTEKDQGCRMEGSPDDLFIFTLNERTGSGYLWDMETLGKEGFSLVNDKRVPIVESKKAGASMIRQTAACSTDRHSGQLSLHHRRPWLGDTSSFEQLSLPYELMGSESGMPRALRRKWEAQAA